jgi:YHS domain-containing protein
MEKKLFPKRQDKCAVCESALRSDGRRLSVGKNGDTVYFCSVKCFKRFEDSPETYSSSDEDDPE